MSSELDALAVAAKVDNGKMLELWYAVENFVYMYAHRYEKSDTFQQVGENRLYDFDDLAQGGFLAVAQAVQNYKPDLGAFTTYLAYYFPDQFNGAAGRRQRPYWRNGKRFWFTPDLGAKSIYASLNDDEFCLVDTLVDSSTDYVYDEADSKMDFEAFMDAARLDDTMKQVTRYMFYHDMKPNEIIAEMPHLTSRELKNIQRRIAVKIKKSPAIRLLFGSKYVNYKTTVSVAIRGRRLQSNGERKGKKEIPIKWVNIDVNVPMWNWEPNTIEVKMERRVVLNWTSK
jgi:DNA-directed RNA polymerase specialized sigma24 family protein